MSIYLESLRSGKLSLIFSSSYLWSWLAFAVLAAVAYSVASRQTFAWLSEGKKAEHACGLEWSSRAAISSGLFWAIVAFHLVFSTSPRPIAASAWTFELSLLLAWALFFILTCVARDPKV
jgi:ABC-type enterochelin transport system permease subunit